MPITLRTLSGPHAKEESVAKLRALIDTPGSTINREDLGVVRKGDEFLTSENDAQYLIREGYAERVVETAAVEEAPAESTPAAETPTASTPPETAETAPPT